MSVIGVNFRGLNIPEETTLPKVAEAEESSTITVPLLEWEREKSKFPKETGKTLLGFLFMIASFSLVLLSMSVTHERLPDRKLHPPLPDIVFDLTEPLDWGLDVTEYILLITLSTLFGLLFFHKHRTIILRRGFMIFGLLYIIRSITLFVTTVPVASLTYYCSPKANSTHLMFHLKRVYSVSLGLGLSINGKENVCGDYIFSGHTVTLILCYLFIKEYSPQRWFILHWLIWILGVIAIVMLLVSRGHYTIDVVIAYFFTTRLFWIYHTLANHHTFKVSRSTNYISRVWWFPLFQYFECNVDGPVPFEYEFPLSWPPFKLFLTHPVDGLNKINIL